MKKVLLLIILIAPLISFSQKEAAIWYFGQHAGLDFNSGTPVVLTDGQINTYEGCATISDYQGNLLFYTDGVTVWNRNHTVMPNGTNLLGNASSSQSAIIVPRPNNLNQYYIFTVDDRNAFSPLSSDGINYSVVDLSLDVAGDVITSQKNINLVPQAYEKITAVKHGDNNSYWVITFIENEFLAWRVSAAGVNTTPVISSVSMANDSRGYLKVSPDGTKIACANFGSPPSLRIFDFNNLTGAVTNESQLTLDENNDIPYGVEFSNNSNKLYVTTSKLSGNEIIPPGKLIQYDMLSANISNSRVLIHSSPVNTRGAIQLAIDGKIYRALSTSDTSPNGTDFLGVINEPEADGLACNYVHDALDISAGDTNRNVVEGLPPFIQSFFLTSIAANNVCFGDETQFNVSSAVTPTSVIWDFGDPASGINNTSADLNPTHIYTSPGVFNVTATVVIDTEVSVLTLEVTIYDAPIVNSPVNLVQCDDDIDGIVDFNLEEANSLISSENPLPTITYFLTENEAIDNIDPIPNPTVFSNNTASIVWARVENVSNCFSTAQVNLEVTSTNIPDDLMVTFNECDDLVDDNDADGISTFDFSSATNTVLNALLPETNLEVAYYESMEDALAEQNSIDPTNYRNTSSPNTQQIVVRVDNLDNECFGLGYHVTLNVNPVPKFDLLESVEFCSNDTIFTISVENPEGSYEYIWTDEGGSEIGNTTEINISSSGIYSVNATDTTNNCETIKSIQVTINNAPIVTSPVTLTECDDDLDGFFNFNLEEANSLISSESPLPTITYFLTEDRAIDNIDPIPNPTAFSNETASVVWARVENEFNCFTTAQVNLEVISINIPDDLMLTFNECDDLIDDNDADGISTFDFSSATNTVLNALLPETNLEVAYYESMEDALAEQNSIDPTNYRNTSSPNTQQIVVRVDNLDNECFGLGYHVTLNVNPVPKFDLLESVEFCSNDTNFSIGVENPEGSYEYIWTDEGGSEIGYTPEINISSSGVYSVNATDTTNNCETFKSIQVTINDAPIVTSPVTLTECDDDLDGFFNFNLEEANSLISSESPLSTITYFLTEDRAIDNIDSIPNPTDFSNETASVVWARVENEFNCFTTAQVNLEVISINIPDDLMVTFNECDDLIDDNDADGISTFDFSSATNTILNALLPETNLAVSYYKNMEDALAEEDAVNPANFRNTNSPHTQEIIVRVDKLTNECFDVGHHITLNVSQVPQYDLPNEVTLCLSSSNTTISVENPQEDYTYTWFDNSDNEIGNTPEIIVTEEGEYRVTATDNFNCFKTKTIFVFNQDVGQLANFSIDNIEINDNSANNIITVSTNNLPNSNYQFALDDGDYQTNNIFENVSGGSHIVRIIDLENCLEASVEIHLISVPNFFTPNNDGYNDTWHVTGIEFQPNSNLYIFDRFGKLIKILDPEGPGWDGFYNGNPLPSTDYWYRVELDDGRILKGHFSLIRR